MSATVFASPASTPSTPSSSATIITEQIKDDEQRIPNITALPGALKVDIAAPPRATEFRVTIEDSDQRRPGNNAGEQRKVSGRLHLSKSMGGMRAKYSEGGLAVEKPIGMERSLSSDSKPGASPSRAVAIPAAKEARPSRPAPARSGGSFSSFIRKLTGRSASPPKSHKSPKAVASDFKRPSSLDGANRTVVYPRPAPARDVAPPRAIPISQSIQPRQALPHLEIPRAEDILACSAPAASEPTAILSGPTPLAPPRPAVDPREVPLPPSPMIEEPEPTFCMSPLDAPAQPPALVKSQSGGLLSPNPFETDEEEELSEEGDRESEESQDIVRPLQTVRIPSSRRDHSPETPISPSTTNEMIVTPTSIGNELSASRFEPRYAGISPPRTAPIGTGGELGRNKSKWRKSVMGLSDTLNSKTPARKGTVKQPPSSYDAYIAHQKRIASNRVSCQPTLHNNASIAAEMREVKDKDQQDMMDTFFMS